jgi:hypothetical protein
VSSVQSTRLPNNVGLKILISKTRGVLRKFDIFAMSGGNVFQNVPDLCRRSFELEQRELGDDDHIFSM